MSTNAVTLSEEEYTQLLKEREALKAIRREGEFVLNHFGDKPVIQFVRWATGRAQNAIDGNIAKEN